MTGNVIVPSIEVLPVGGVSLPIKVEGEDVFPTTASMELPEVFVITATVTKIP